MTKTRLGTLVGMGLAMALGACGPGGTTTDSGTKSDTVSGPCGSATNPIMVGMPLDSFTPSTCQVAAGSTVNWKWAVSGHSVTSDATTGTTFDSTVQSGGSTFMFVVPTGTASGTAIHFHCSVHGSVSAGVCTGMCGILTVK